MSHEIQIIVSCEVTGAKFSVPLWSRIQQMEWSTKQDEIMPMGENPKMSRAWSLSLLPNVVSSVLPTCHDNEQSHFKALSTMIKQCGVAQAPSPRLSCDSQRGGEQGWAFRLKHRVLCLLLRDETSYQKYRLDTWARYLSRHTS